MSLSSAPAYRIVKGPPRFLGYQDGLWTFGVPSYRLPKRPPHTSRRALLARLALTRREKRQLRLLTWQRWSA